MEKMRLEQILSKYWKNFEIKEINEKEFEVKLFLNENFNLNLWRSLFHMISFYFNIGRTIIWNERFGHLSSIIFSVSKIEWQDE